MKLPPKKKALFQKTVWDYYKKNARRTLPWRKNTSPYYVWISEVMLQQTQVDRVVLFFKNWVRQFPNIKKLANASQVDLLRAWKGLGYNSRALRLKNAAQIIVKDYRGVFPKHYEEILALPGIGPYTAGAISAFAYNVPVTMIETNIRRVYLHHFYPSPLRGAPLSKGSQGSDRVLSKHCLPLPRGGGRRPEGSVHDRDLMELIRQTVDQKKPQEWYWALMDYGAYLGKTIPNPNKKSRHYTVQKKFKGSDREIRGKILELLLHKKNWSFEKLFVDLSDLSQDCDRLELILDQLEKEKFITINKNTISLKK